MNFYYSIASGSTGNCGIYVCDNTTILMDLGVSVRALTTALKNISLEIEDIDAVLITHEHTDHIKGISTFTKKYDIPIYASTGTAKEIYKKTPHAIGMITEFVSGCDFDIANVHIESMRTPHDAVDSVGYLLTSENHTFGFVTDIGFMPLNVQEKLKTCHTIVLESNHDIQMLREGPYPWHLKQRVSGNQGHLSNDDCALCLQELAHSGVQTIILAHLSEKNNTPSKVLKCAMYAVKDTDCQLYVAPKMAMEQPLYIGGNGDAHSEAYLRREA